MPSLLLVGHPDSHLTVSSRELSKLSSLPTKLSPGTRQGQGGCNQHCEMLLQLHSRMACNEDIKEPGQCTCLFQLGTEFADFGYLFSDSLRTLS